MFPFFQAIEHTFHRRSMLIAESVNHMLQHLTFMALACIDTAKVQTNLRNIFVILTVYH